MEKWPERRTPQRAPSHLSHVKTRETPLSLRRRILQIRQQEDERKERALRAEQQQPENSSIDTTKGASNADRARELQHLLAQEQVEADRLESERDPLTRSCHYRGELRLRGPPRLNVVPDRQGIQIVRYQEHATPCAMSPPPDLPALRRALALLKQDDEVPTPRTPSDSDCVSDPSTWSPPGTASYRPSTTSPDWSSHPSSLGGLSDSCSLAPSGVTTASWISTASELSPPGQRRLLELFAKERKGWIYSALKAGTRADRIFWAHAVELLDTPALPTWQTASSVFQDIIKERRLLAAKGTLAQPVLGKAGEMDRLIDRCVAIFHEREALKELLKKGKIEPQVVPSIVEGGNLQAVLRQFVHDSQEEEDEDEEDEEVDDEEDEEVDDEEDEDDKNKERDLQGEMKEVIVIKIEDDDDEGLASPSPSSSGSEHGSMMVRGGGSHSKLRAPTQQNGLSLDEEVAKLKKELRRAVKESRRDMMKRRRQVLKLELMLNKALDTA